MQEEFELRDFPCPLQITKVIVQNPSRDSPQPPTMESPLFEALQAEPSSRN